MPISPPASGRTFIIAEAGVNHNGKEDLAMRLINVAADAGADAVKFQLFDPDELAGGAPLATYQQQDDAVWSDQHAMLASLTLSQETYRHLAAHARERKIALIVTPFDIASARFLLTLPVKTLKIPSGEITNLPFLKKVAELGAEVILSTGMSTMDEVREAVGIFHNAHTPLSLLHCTSAYPAPFDHVHLRAIASLRETFGLPVGLSDHTKGIEVAIAAVACGASIIEKHFTLDRTLPGPDHRSSIEPAELALMIRSIRHVEAALGSPLKMPQESEKNVAAVARRSVVVVHNLRKGQALTEVMIAIRRPGTGIPPKFFPEVIGKTVTRDIRAGTPLTRDMLA